MKVYLIDLFERVVTTGAFTFLSVFSLSDLGTFKTASIASLAAALSVIKGSLAVYVGDESPGLKR